MDRASRFYTETFQVSPLMESEGWTTLDFGSVVLGLHSLPAESDVVLPNAVLNLEVENIVGYANDLANSSSVLHIFN